MVQTRQPQQKDNGHLAVQLSFTCAPFYLSIKGIYVLVINDMFFISGTNLWIWQKKIAMKYNHVK